MEEEVRTFCCIMQGDGETRRERLRALGVIAKNDAIKERIQRELDTMYDPPDKQAEIIRIK